MADPPESLAFSSMKTASVFSPVVVLTNEQIFDVPLLVIVLVALEHVM
jgi:hypothetical protein